MIYLITDSMYFTQWKSALRTSHGNYLRKTSRYNNQTILNCPRPCSITGRKKAEILSILINPIFYKNIYPASCLRSGLRVKCITALGRILDINYLPERMPRSLNPPYSWFHFLRTAGKQIEDTLIWELILIVWRPLP